MIRYCYRLLPGLLLLFVLQLRADADYADRDDVKAFAREVAVESALGEKHLLALLRMAEYKQSVINAISRPAEKTLTWAEYQDIFLTDTRRRRGIEFLYKHKEALIKARKVYGVPPVVVTAIIGVETMYGRNKGSYRVLDSLSTLAFDYPPRSRFFRKELKEFILLAHEENRAITELKGSYAGAMGIGQFIPSSYRRFAVDFDGDGFKDIWDNEADAIASVANYLREHGWLEGELITLPINGSSVPEGLFNANLKPDISLRELRQLGAVGQSSLSGDLKVSPMLLEGKQGIEHWIGLYNFYVITRYNRSRLYAMAVFQLSEGLRDENIRFSVR